MREALAGLPTSYEESTARFRQGIEQVRRQWPNARLGRHRLGGNEDVSIDWIEADALEEKQKLLILTSGQHGVEAYVGAAVLQLFVEECLPRLEPRTTGLLIVHAVNPWGMKHKRRTNARNVDLNRNFLWDANAFDESFNPDYAGIESFLNPKGPIRSLFLSRFSFLFRLLCRVVSLGPRRLRKAVLLGQYRFPKGIYYGGAELQEETRVLMSLLRSWIGEHEHVVHLDMHSGWGRRYQMSVVTSPMEPRDSEELERQFAYPQVVKANRTQFYSMRGDLIDYVYGLVRSEFPNRRLFAASFEFGTLGDSALATIGGLRAEVFENRLHWFGARSPRARERIARAFAELNAPRAERWRIKAVADARQAFQGILRAEGFLSQ